MSGALCEEAGLMGLYWARRGVSRGLSQQADTLSGHGDQLQVLQGLHGW